MRLIPGCLIHRPAQKPVFRIGRLRRLKLHLPGQQPSQQKRVRPHPPLLGQEEILIILLGPPQPFELDAGHRPFHAEPASRIKPGQLCRIGRFGRIVLFRQSPGPLDQVHVLQIRQPRPKPHVPLVVPRPTYGTSPASSAIIQCSGRRNSAGQFCVGAPNTSPGAKVTIRCAIGTASNHGLSAGLKLHLFVLQRQHHPQQRMRFQDRPRQHRKLDAFQRRCPARRRLGQNHRRMAQPILGVEMRRGVGPIFAWLAGS